jgi:hypothetical protein
VPSPAPRGRSRAGTPNPRSGRGRALRRNASRRQCPRAGEPIVRNKASCSRATREAGTWLKKNHDTWDTHMAAAKQSQLPHEQAWARGGKAAGAATGTDRAKRSQLALHRREGAMAAGPGAPPPLGASVSNEANGQRGKPGRRAKQSQSARCMRGEPRRSWPPCLCRGAAVRNEANFRGQAGAIDLGQAIASGARQSATVCRRQPPEVCATQFRGVCTLFASNHPQGLPALRLPPNPTKCGRLHLPCRLTSWAESGLIPRACWGTPNAIRRVWRP